MSGDDGRVFTFVLLGGTGDLSHRKILPALSKLRQEGAIAEESVLVGVARDAGMDDAAYREFVCGAMAEGGTTPDAVARWVNHSAFYHPAPTGAMEDYHALAARIARIEHERSLPSRRVLYMALPPAAFRPTITALGEAGLNRSSAERRGAARRADPPAADPPAVAAAPTPAGAHHHAAAAASGSASGSGRDGSWARLVVEKPFGRDLASAQALNQLIHRYFEESQVYRIDHYLGKETVQNLLIFRFSNSVFESLWNRDHVESVQITVAEQIGVEGRAGYYEQAGAVRDIIQNHGTQLLALVAMEVPTMMDAAFIRQEKVKVLRSIAPIAPRDIVLGQYTRGVVCGAPAPGYREEPGVARASNTETYAALQLDIDNWRWQGVPFFLRTGKRLAERVTEIEVKFRRPPVWMFKPMGSPDVHRNTLRLTIQPREGFALFFHVKAPGKPLRLERLPLDFCYEERFREIPEAYQTLLLDIVDGDQTLFVSADEVEASWRLYTPLVDSELPVSEYRAGSWGPEAADALLARSGHWWGER